MTDSPATAKKKGWWPFAILGGGCLVLIVIAAIGVGLAIKKGKNWVKDFQENPGRKIAELAIKNDPDLELVGSDDADGTITFRDKRTGKETTVEWDQVRDGKIVVTSGEETATMNLKEGKATVVGPEGTSTFEAGGGIERLPQWFELPDGISEWRSAAHQEQANGLIAGVIAGASERSLEELTADFEKNLAEAGFTRKAKTELEGRVLLHFEDTANKRSLSVTIFDELDLRGVTIGYEQR